MASHLEGNLPPFSNSYHPFQNHLLCISELRSSPLIDLQFSRPHMSYLLDIQDEIVNHLLLVRHPTKIMIYQVCTESSHSWKYQFHNVHYQNNVGFLPTQ